MKNKGYFMKDRLDNYKQILGRGKGMEHVLEYLDKDQLVILRLTEPHPKGRLEIPNAKIDSINNESIYIEIPPMPYDMFTGRGINILWEKYNSFYCLNSVVQKFIQEAPARLQVEYSDRLECIEKRRYIRLDDPLQLTFAVNGIPNFFSAQTVDISGGGIKFISPVRLNIGQQLEIILELPLFPYIDIMTRGEVIWVDRDKTGINFIQINSADQKRIIQYILERRSSLVN